MNSKVCEASIPTKAAELSTTLSPRSSRASGTQSYLMEIIENNERQRDQNLYPIGEQQEILSSRGCAGIRKQSGGNRTLRSDESSVPQVTLERIQYRGDKIRNATSQKFNQVVGTVIKRHVYRNKRLPAGTEVPKLDHVVTIPKSQPALTVAEIGTSK